MSEVDAKQKEIPVDKKPKWNVADGYARLEDCTASIDEQLDRLAKIESKSDDGSAFRGFALPYGRGGLLEISFPSGAKRWLERRFACLPGGVDPREK